MNELIYQVGGTLVLDEPFNSQPVSATISIHTMRDGALTVINNSFTAITDEVCVCDDLVLTLGASAKGARIFTPSATAGTIPNLTDESYRLLISRGGRIYFAHVSEYDTALDDSAIPVLEVTTFRVDEGIDFPISAGDKAYGIRVSYDLDWTAVTADWAGQVKAIWTVTLTDGSVRRIGRVYDCVKQVLNKPATWADVVARRPDADSQMSEIRDKERFVDVAWDDIVTRLYNLGIRHNLVFPEYSTVLRDATVMQCIYNLTMHQGLPAPMLFLSQGQDYLSWLNHEINASLGQFLLPVDNNEDGELTAGETGVGRRGVWLRSRTNRNNYSEFE